MGTQYHQMTRDERLKLEALRRAGVPVAQCARQLGFCRQTIYNELKRGECSLVRERHGYYCDVKEYSADKGQQLHDAQQAMKGRPMKIGTDRAYADFLERKMLGAGENGKVDRRRRFSPAAALAAARQEGFQTSVCVNTVYSYIEKGVFLRLTNKDLWEKGKHKKRDYDTVQRVAHPKLPGIWERPEPINRRQEYGHWEMDLVVGRAKSRAVLLTLTERSTRQEMIFKLPDRRAATIRAVFDKLEKRLGRKRFREQFRSLTTDNGSEFLEYDKLVQSVYGGRRFDVWYCHSYAAWEKGTNENHNRMIRRWFPKGTDFGEVKNTEIAALQDWMNGYPRKALNWKTPMEAAS